jgi:hypothetical protein
VQLTAKRGQKLARSGLEATSIPIQILAAISESLELPAPFLNLFICLSNFKLETSAGGSSGGWIDFRNRCAGNEIEGRLHADDL